MTPQDYRNLIIKTYIETTGKKYWNLTDEGFQYFADIAKAVGSGRAVMENWKIFLTKEVEHSPELFFEWYQDIYLYGLQED
jgi:DNA-binding PadR family transcriptional regulator